MHTAQNATMALCVTSIALFVMIVKTIYFAVLLDRNKHTAVRYMLYHLVPPGKIQVKFYHSSYSPRENMSKINDEEA